MEKCQLVVIPYIPYSLPTFNHRQGIHIPQGDEDRQGFTISAVPTPSVFLYQLWSKFHRVFNKSHGFKNGFAHGTHRSFEIEKDYKERLNFRKTTKKDYKRCIDTARLLASQPPLCFDDFDSLCHHGETPPASNLLESDSHQRNCMQARLPDSIMLWKEIIIARYCSS